MNCFKMPFIALLFLGLVCSIQAEVKSETLKTTEKNGNERDKENTGTSTTTVAPTAEEVTTPNPISACGGLKGFFHLCDTHNDEDLIKKVRNVKETDSKESTEHSGENSQEEKKTGNDEDDDDVKVEPIPREQIKKKRQVEFTENNPPEEESSDKGSTASEPEEQEQGQDEEESVEETEDRGVQQTQQYEKKK